MRWKLLSLAFLVAVGFALAATSPALASYDVSANCQSAGVSVPCDGWHQGPVQIYWTWTPSTDGNPAPGTCITQSFGSDTSTVVSCDVSGSNGIGGTNQTIDVETSSPTASGSLTRPPDSNGWYNHPVGLSMAGSSFSGIASCSSPTYGGPSGANVTAVGSCTDNAGKTATAGVSLNYDDTPPTITGAKAGRAPDSGGYYTHAVTFSFQGTDSVSGIASCDTVTYRGPASGSVVGGCHDVAGNYATISVPVRYRAVAPRASVAKARSSLVLHWKAVKHASYYNVQVFRAGKKVLSAWPSHRSLRLHRSWKFAGHRFRLRKGSYRWYVWPGFGSRKAARYGHRWVAATFRLTKPV